MNPVLTYSLARLTLFVVALVGLGLLGAGRLTAVVGAAVISMLLSYVLLRGLRDRVADRVAARVEGRLDRAAERRAAADPHAE